MYRTWVAAHKGRVGKTTVGANRAAELAGVPHVLMVDPDPQGGLDAAFGHDADKLALFGHARLTVDGQPATVDCQPSTTDPADTPSASSAVPSWEAQHKRATFSCPAALLTRVEEELRNSGRSNSAVVVAALQADLAGL